MAALGLVLTGPQQELKLVGIATAPGLQGGGGYLRGLVLGGLRGEASRKFGSLVGVFVAEVLCDSHPCGDLAVLLTSELVTNRVLHSGEVVTIMMMAIPMLRVGVMPTAVVPIVMNPADQVRPQLADFGIRTPYLIDATGSVSRAYGMLGKGMRPGLPGHGFVLIDARHPALARGAPLHVLVRRRVHRPGQGPSLTSARDALRGTMTNRGQTR